MIDHLYEGKVVTSNADKSPSRSLTARHPYETAEFEDFAQTARRCSFPPCQAKNPRGAARVKAGLVTTQERGRLEARWARGHTHRMAGMRT